MSRNSKLMKSAAIALMQIALVSATAIEASAADTNYELKPINLPGASGPVALDYFAYDGATGKLWVPASNTGSVDVIEPVKSSDAEERSQSDQLRPAWAMVSFTLGTAGTRRFASSMRRVLRASIACRSQQITS